MRLGSAARSPPADSRGISNPMKKLAAVFVAFMMVFLIWTLFGHGTGDMVHITINGQEVSHPIVGFLGGVAGMAIAFVALVCTAIFLLFIFTGVGLFIIAAPTLLGCILVLTIFPFLFPLALPLLGIFIFFVILRARS